MPYELTDTRYLLLFKKICHSSDNGLYFQCKAESKDSGLCDSPEQPSFVSNVGQKTVSVEHSTPGYNNYPRRSTLENLLRKSIVLPDDTTKEPCHLESRQY